MDFPITEHMIRQYSSNVELTLQSKKHWLMGTYSTGQYRGEAGQVVRKFGETEFNEKLSRHADTQFSDIAHKQRWVYPKDYTLALPVDKEDEIKMLDSPQSPYVMAMAAAWNRRQDKTLYEAFFADAKTGKDGGTTTAFDTSNQQIAVAATGLTLDKLLQAQEILGNNYADEDEKAFIAITPKQLTDLLETTEVKSADYNTVKTLVEGKVDEFLGFKFIKFPYMRSISSSLDASSYRRIPCWVQSGMHMGNWNSRETRIGERADKEYTTQVFMRGSHGATRTDEGKVVEILCSEA